MIGGRGAPGGQIGNTPSGPVIAMLGIGITARHRSTKVSSVTAPVTGSTSLTFKGKGIVTRISPFFTRFVKSVALFPFTRKSSASTGRKSGSSAFGSTCRLCCRAMYLAWTAAGESWKPWDGMWQSAQERPLPPSPLRMRSLKAAFPLDTSSHGLTSQMVGRSCPKPVRGDMDAITTTNESKTSKAMSDFLTLFMVLLRSSSVTVFENDLTLGFRFKPTSKEDVL